MKIKFGAIVVDGRGKLGGHVFSKNAAGSYMRTKVTPTNPQTARQTSVRALFASIASAWSALSAVLINEWNEAVAEWSTTNVFGDLKKPTGKSLFQRLNNQAQVVGLAGFTAVPARLALPDAPISDVDIDLTASEINPTGYDTDAGTTVVVYGASPVSNGTTNVKSKMRQIYYAQGNAYSATAAFSAYEAKFGAILANDNVFIGVKYVLASGQASPLQTQKAVITP